MNENEERPEDILARLRRIQSQEYEDALAVLRRLRDKEKVSDGDLVDAVFAFTARTDLANPLVPLMSYFIGRFMYFAGIPQTPKGLQRDYFAEGVKAAANSVPKDSEGVNHG